MAVAGHIELEIKARIDKIEKDMREFENRAAQFERKGQAAFDGVSASANELVAAFARLRASVDSSTGAMQREVAQRLTNIERSVDRLDRGVDDLGRSAPPAFERTTQAIDRTARSARQLDGVSRTMRNLAITFAAAFSARELQQLSDAYVTANNLLAATAREGENVALTFERIRSVAEQTRAPLEALVALYNRGSLAADQLGASQQELERFIGVVGRALAIQGGGAQQARGALVQLSQAIGAGIVRAEEFNSILEGALPIAQAVARGIERTGGSVALLRREIVEGRVTSEEFFRALLSQSEEVAAAFDRTVPTVSQALTVLRNNLIAAFGENTREAFAGVSRALLAIANNLDVATAAVATLTAAMLANRVAALAAASANTTFATALGLLTVRGGAAIVMAQGLRAALAFMTGPVGIALAGVGALAGGLVLYGRYARTAAEAQAELDQQIENARTTYRTLDDEINDGVTFAQAARHIADMTAEVNGLTGEALASARALRQQELTDYQSRIEGAQEAVATLTAELQRLRVEQETAAAAPMGAGLLPVSDQEIQAVADELTEVRDLLRDLIVERDRLASSPLLPVPEGPETPSEEAENVLTALQRQRDVLRANSELEGRIVANLARAGLERNDQTRLARNIRDVTAEIYRIEQQRQRAEEIQRANQSLAEFLTALEDEHRLAQLIGTERERQEIILRAQQIAGRELTETERDRLNLIVLQNAALEAQFAEMEKLKGDQDAQREAGQALGRLDQSSPLGARQANPLETLQDEYNQRLEIIRNAVALEIETEEQGRERILELDRQFMEARRALLVGAGEQMFGQLAGLARQYAGEQSGVYKTLFAIEQAFAMANAVMNAQVAISKAAASAPPPFNAAAIAMAIAQTAPPIATIAAQTFAAFADGGYVSGTGTGTSDSINARLSNGEYVINAGATRRNRALLDAINDNQAMPGMGGKVQIDIKQAPGIQVDFVRKGDGYVEMVAKHAVASEAPGVIASAMDDPNSRVSKSMGRNVNAARRRN